jgi:hypothetical protein
MADKEKMKQLIWDCQKDIAAYLPPESSISEHELVKMLIARLDGRQAKEALIGSCHAERLTSSAAWVSDDLRAVKIVSSPQF